MAVDVLLVALGSTAGLRAAEAELAAALERAGAGVAVVTAAPQPDVRTLMLTDLAWARAARAAARAGLAEHRPRAVVYSTITATLGWPRPGAIRYDAPAAANRPGRHGLWQRPLERRRLRQAPLLLPHDAGALAETPTPHAPALVLPIPVEPSGGRAGAAGAAPAARDVAAVTYAANPEKKGLATVAAAFAAVRRPGERLVVAGIAPSHPAAVAARALAPVDDADRWIELTGVLDATVYRALLRRARVYVTAPRREDYGIAQLEALVDGCTLVTTAAPGPYAALPLARALDGRLVVDGRDADALARALRIALDDPVPAYAGRALELTAPFRRAAVDALVAHELLPALLG